MGFTNSIYRSPCITHVELDGFCVTFPVPGCLSHAIVQVVHGPDQRTVLLSILDWYMTRTAFHRISNLNYGYLNVPDANTGFNA